MVLGREVNYKTYSSEGFVIARRNFGEADRILVLFTKDFGKSLLIAKGVRKLTSRKRGGIEIFSHIKFSAIKGKNLDILSEVKVIDTYETTKKDLRKVSVGYYFCEVIAKITEDSEVHSELFNILENFLKELETTKNLKKLRLEFVKEVLVNLGFWPSTKKLDNPDLVIESVIERKINSSRVGKKMLQ